MVSWVVELDAVDADGQGFTLSPDLLVYAIRVGNANWPTCRQIIQAHHRHIWAENNPDGGTIGRLLLPFQQCD